MRFSINRPSRRSKKKRMSSVLWSCPMPQWKQQFGGAWDAIAGAEDKYESRIKFYAFRGLDSQLAEFAETIVEYVAEIKKPAGERLPGYQEAQLDSLRLQLFSPAPIYPEFEKAKLAGSLRLDLQQLGNDDPFLKARLGRQDTRTSGCRTGRRHQSSPIRRYASNWSRAGRQRLMRRTIP